MDFEAFQKLTSSPSDVKCPDNVEPKFVPISSTLVVPQPALVFDCNEVRYATLVSCPTPSNSERPDEQIILSLRAYLRNKLLETFTTEFPVLMLEAPLMSTPLNANPHSLYPCTSWQSLEVGDLVAAPTFRSLFGEPRRQLPTALLFCRDPFDATIPPHVASSIAMFRVVARGRLDCWWVTPVAVKSSTDFIDVANKLSSAIPITTDTSNRIRFKRDQLRKIVSTKNPLPPPQMETEVISTRAPAKSVASSILKKFSGIDSDAYWNSHDVAEELTLAALSTAGHGHSSHEAKRTTFAQLNSDLSHS